MPGTLIIGRSRAMFEERTGLMFNREWGTAGGASLGSPLELRKSFQGSESV